VETLDLGDLYASIQAHECGPGRPPADPRILLAVWLYATREGIGSARQVAKACVSDAAYRWLKAEVESDPDASSRRRQAARRRAAEDVARRAEAARRVVEKLRAEKIERAKRHKKAEAERGEARASATDPEARAMRFADGAIRLGYNVQLAASPETGVIVAVDVTDRRNDTGLAEPMVKLIESRFAVAPKRALVDTTYATHDDMVALAERGTDVYSPVPEDRSDIKPASLRRRAAQRRSEPDAVKAWRERMARPEAEEIYSRRKRIETINGILKGRGFGILRVRSIAKAKCIALLQALAHNLWRAHGLRALAA